MSQDLAHRRRRRTRHEVLVSHERWLVSYADFMTLLFAFFVVLFATSPRGTDELGRLSGALRSGFQGRRAVPAPTPSSSIPRAVADPRSRKLPPPTSPVQPKTPGDDLGLVTSQLQEVLGGSIAKHEVLLTQTSDGLVISFQEAGFFHSAEANLLAGRADVVLRAGAVLRAHRSVLRVEGHSDDQPIHNGFFASNWELSAARAMTVLLLLVDQDQYDPTCISMAGFGPYRPVADNATEEGRQRNRRVDLVVLRSQQPAVAASAQ